MTKAPLPLDPMVAAGKRNRLEFMEATIANARKCPPGVDPRFHRLDMKGWKRAIACATSSACRRPMTPWRGNAVQGSGGRDEGAGAAGAPADGRQ